MDGSGSVGSRGADIIPCFAARRPRADSGFFGAVPPIPHAFHDERLLELALTHASAGPGADNERLEFLGDAVLALVVAEELYRIVPPLDEGAMTELKAWVVSRRVLAGVARGLGLAERARVGSGLRERTLTSSMLANLYEATLGAVFLDGGLEAARAFALETLRVPLERVQAMKSAPNEKQVLQRHSQTATGVPPTYVLLAERGHAHAKAFLVAAEIDGRRFPSAWGRTRKEAERWAAHEALLVLDEEKDATA
jgi:ribonuclease-3